MKWKTPQSLSKQCKQHRTVSTTTTCKNISFFSIESQIKVLQDLRKIKYVKWCVSGAISVGGEVAGGRGVRGCASQRIQTTAKKGIFVSNFGNSGIAPADSQAQDRWHCNHARAGAAGSPSGSNSYYPLVN